MHNNKDLGFQRFKSVRIHFQSINACLIFKFYKSIEKEYFVPVPTTDGSIIWHIKNHLSYLSKKPCDPARLCLGLDPITTLAWKQNDVQKGRLLGVAHCL